MKSIYLILIAVAIVGAAAAVAVLSSIAPAGGFNSNNYEVNYTIYIDSNVTGRPLRLLMGWLVVGRGGDRSYALGNLMGFQTKAVGEGAMASAVVCGYGVCMDRSVDVSSLLKDYMPSGSGPREVGSCRHLGYTGREVEYGQVAVSTALSQIVGFSLRYVLRSCEVNGVPLFVELTAYMDGHMVSRLVYNATRAGPFSSAVFDKLKAEVRRG